MVNHGRSGACLTCKQRRVKCDEARPECQPCKRLKFRCGGYNSKSAKVRFKDEAHKFCTKIGPENASRDKQQMPSLRTLAEPDTSVPFFLQHYAIMGRNMESARGFFELLAPVYSSQRQNSALALAVSAVASEIMSLWRHENSFQAPQEAYSQALKCLRSTIQDRNEWGKPATVLAVLSLQFFENVADIYGLRPASLIHHDGAVSLLPFADSEDTNVLTNTFIRNFIFHTEISSAMRQQKPLHSIVRSLTRSKSLTIRPDNPSSALDAIGASVAELQASYLQLKTQDDTMLSVQHGPRDWRAEAKFIDEKLLAWARSLPRHWQPQKLTSGQDIDASIHTYQSVCEVYPSCQIGTIWNLWRVQPLVLVKIILGSMRTLFSSVSFELTEDEKKSRNGDFVKYQHTLQELVDSVCHSVPFYLGNQAGSLSIADFTNPAILLPSYYAQAWGVEGSLNEHNHNTRAPGEEHRSNIIAQGPWHVMSPLSRLLTFFSEDHGYLMATFLGPGQYEWIREQFLRVITLLRIPLTGTGHDDGGLQHCNSSSRQYVNSGVEDLARGVRKSAIFMSGP